MFEVNIRPIPTIHTEMHTHSSDLTICPNTGEIIIVELTQLYASATLISVLLTNEELPSLNPIMNAATMS